MRNVKFGAQSLFVILLLAVNSSFSQSYEFKARISENGCVQVDIHEESGKIYYNRYYIACTEDIHSALFNISDAQFNEGVISIPSAGDYWIVPFDDSDPFAVRCNALCFDCFCHGGGGSNDGCGWSGSGGGASCGPSSSCACCQAFIHPCDGNRESGVEHRGVLVRASECIRGF